MCDVTRTQHNIALLASLPGSQGSVDITKYFQGIEGRSYLSNYRTTNVWGAEKNLIFPNFQRIPRNAKIVWRFQGFTIVNTKASIWPQNCSRLLGHYLFLVAHISLLGTDNVRRQISEDIFVPNAGYCSYHGRKQMGRENKCPLSVLNRFAGICPLGPARVTSFTKNIKLCVNLRLEMSQLQEKKTFMSDWFTQCKTVY